MEQAIFYTRNNPELFLVQQYFHPPVLPLYGWIVEIGHGFPVGEGSYGEAGSFDEEAGHIIGADGGPAECPDAVCFHASVCIGVPVELGNQPGISLHQPYYLIQGFKPGCFKFRFRLFKINSEPDGIG